MMLKKEKGMIKMSKFYDEKSLVNYYNNTHLKIQILTPYEKFNSDNPNPNQETESKELRENKFTMKENDSVEKFEQKQAYVFKKETEEGIFYIVFDEIHYQINATKCLLEATLFKKRDFEMRQGFYHNNIVHEIYTDENYSEFKKVPVTLTIMENETKEEKE